MTNAAATTPSTPAHANPRGRYVVLDPGDPAPWFTQRSGTNDAYVFDTTAGRYIVLCFLGSAGDAAGRAALGAVAAHRSLFDDANICFFGVSNDPADEPAGRLRHSLPGLRFLLDFDGQVARLYGALPTDAPEGGPKPAIRRFWLVLDPTMRVLARVPFASDAGDQSELFALLRRLPPPGRFAGVEIQAPVLYLPQVFEPDLCRTLIAAYERQGGSESGVMRDVAGRTVNINDHKYKRRRDCTIEDPELIRVLQARIRRRVVPEILKIHCFQATRMERYIVACYAAEDEAHFRAHRDNTTLGTAHRRFAVSINLNAEFEGGEVSFPEYGPRSFKPPPGGAVVFSCSLLHAVSKVTSGRRYAFLPFLYDEVGAQIRAKNNAFLEQGLGTYVP